MSPDDTTLQDVLDSLGECAGDRREEAHSLAAGIEAFVADADAAVAAVMSQTGAFLHAFGDGEYEHADAIDTVWRMLQTVSAERLVLPGVPPADEEAGAAEASAATHATEGQPSEEAVPLEEPPPAPENHAPAATSEVVVAPEMPPFIIVHEEADLIVECAEECVENLGVAENAVLELESDPANDELVNTVFRSFHTIKGIAGFLDLGPVSHLAHRAESLLAKVRAKELDFAQGHSTALLQSIDCLGKMLEDLRQGPGEDGGVRIDVPPRWDAVYTSIRLEAPPEGAAEPPESPWPSPEVAPSPEPNVAPPSSTSAGAVPAAAPEPPGPAPAAQNAGPPKAAAKPQADAFVRVRTDRLDQLLDAVGELVIAQTMVSDRSASVDADGTDFVETISQTGKIVRELQDLAMSLRMVPMASTFQRMTRVARDVAAKCGRKVRLETVGEDTEIDRNLVGLLSEPLIHMIRNAVDHGVESADVRQGVGKDPVGTITLSATAEAGRIAVRIRDDGAGLDPEKLMAKARKNGILGPDERLSDADAFRLIFHAGFSTAEKVTATSGRGVGMDVVRRNVEVLGGRIQVDSVLGEGTTFSIFVPLTLAITDGMIVGVANERYILPTLNIEMSFQPTPEILADVPGRGEVVLVRGNPIPLLRLHEVFDIAGARTVPSDALLVLMADGERRFALLVDEVVGQHQVVTKALDVGAQAIAGLGGAAILGDGRVGLIVDPGGMGQRVARRGHLSPDHVPSLH